MTARKTTGALMVAFAALFALAGPAAGITVTWHAQNAACYLGMPFADLEFENPLTGSEMVLDHKILQWRDADYTASNPPSYDDWTVHDMGGTINGNANEIWMRGGGTSNQWIETSTTVASSIVSIHMGGDGNDGLADIAVDGTVVASVDMGTAGIDRLLIIVKDLANTTHNIEVRQTGVGSMGGSDVHTLGAAALGDPDYKWQQPPRNTTVSNLFYGWNEPSVYEMTVAADDWVCNDDNPISDIHWWGSFIGWKSAETPPMPPDRWHITIWTDTPQGVQDPFSHPKQVVWERDYPNTGGTFVGWDFDPRSKTWDACFKWDLTLPYSDWFWQEKNPTGGPNIYWISIAGIYDSGLPGQYMWGWKTRPREPNSPAPDAAVSIINPNMPHLNDLYSLGSPLIFENQQWDLAFELSATPITEKWSQPPDYSQGTVYGWDEPSMYGKGQIVSDDWICQDMRKVSDIHWWGSYLNYLEPIPPMNGPATFHVGIWTDYVPGLPFPHPQQCIWQYVATRASLNEHYYGMDYYPGKPPDACFQYDLILPQAMWFQQQTAVGRYWLTIAAQYTGTPTNTWGWKTKPHSYGGDAVRITNPTAPVIGSTYVAGSQVLDPQGVSFDASFQLTSMGAEYMKWSQPPQPYTSGNFFDGWDDLSVYDPAPGSQIDADDWVCTTRDPVSNIRWWGSFIGWSEAQPPQLPDEFRIAIWDDVPAFPPLEPFSHPGAVLHEYACYDYTWKFVGWDIDPRNPTAPPEACFKFEWDMPKELWFCQGEGDHIYWLSVAAEKYNIQPTHYLWGWKTRMRDPLSPAPDAAVSITNTVPTWPPVLGCQYDSGFPIMWPNGTDQADLSFALSTVHVGSLTFANTFAIPNHFWWWRDPDQDNEMLSMTVSTDANEPVTWDTLTINAFGTGDDAADILTADVWIDNNGDNQVDPLDTQIGTGAYPVDNGQIVFNIATIPGGSPVVIPVGSSIRVLIAYRMNTAAPAQGKNYTLKVVGAAGTGSNSGCPVPIYGLSITSATKRTRTALTIGEAKLLPLGSEVLLDDKELTALLRAPGWPAPWNWFYIEECSPTTMRANGIGVIGGTLPALVAIGDRVSLIGATVLVNTAELMIQPTMIVSSAHSPTITPLGKNNRSSGGGVYGAQPKLYDDDQGIALPVPSVGLNDVGSLVRLWGRVTGYGSVSLGGGNLVDVFWMDDGSRLHDGYLTTIPAQQFSQGVAVVTPRNVSQPPTGIWGCTGIMRAIQNPNGRPVRLLVPRDYVNDMTWYAPVP